MSKVKIVGVGAYVPQTEINNIRLQELVDTSDEWITTRTGIKTRYVSIDEETSDLAYKASLVAIENAKMDVMDIDAIILATVTPDKFTPATACILQSKLGAKNAYAFDISAACTGFIYGLKVASSLIESGGAKNVLVVGAETLSKVLNWEDRGTCVLFGDGSGAAVLSKSDEEGIKDVIIKSDGTKGNALTIDGVALNNPFTTEKRESDNYIKMNGSEVFKFATKAIEESILEVVKNNDTTLENIKYIVPHQANLRIIDYASRKLNVSKDKFIVNLDKYGNTSGATVPIALYEIYKEGKLAKGDEIILVGFGGGLTWGSALIKW